MCTRRLMILWQLGWILMGVGQSWADAPVEQYYLKLSEIPPSVLRDARGALTILCQDPSYMKKYLGRHVDEVKIMSFVKDTDGFREKATMNLERTQPLSGWIFDGTRVRRFPVVARTGEYLEIIYDVKGDRRAWIRSKDVSQLMPKGWGRSFRLAWFGGRTSGEEIRIDVFLLLTHKKIRLYQAPNGSCMSRTVSSEYDLQGTGRGMWAGNLVITEQRDGFARLGVQDPCDEHKLRQVGWIRVRDDKGRLTVWPQVGLSC